MSREERRGLPRGVVGPALLNGDRLQPLLDGGGIAWVGKRIERGESVRAAVGVEESAKLPNQGINSAGSQMMRTVAVEDAVQPDVGTTACVDLGATPGIPAEEEFADIIRRGRRKVRRSA